jgi:hypothetical protein
LQLSGAPSVISLSYQHLTLTYQETQSESFSSQTFCEYSGYFVENNMLEYEQAEKKIFFEYVTYMTSLIITVSNAGSRMKT